MIHSERGLTFVELLSTLTILSFIGIIIWSVFLQGATFSQKSSTKNALQQEANITISTLTKIHQTSKQYQIDNSGCKIAVTITKKDSTVQTQEFSNSKFCISARVVDIDTQLEVTGPVDPNNNDISFAITVYDLNDSKNIITVNGFLYKLKDGGI